MQALIAKFLDDQSGLTGRDVDALCEGLQASPELRTELKEQLITDDLLLRTLRVERRHFALQVRQRVAELGREDDFTARVVSEARRAGRGRAQVAPRRHVPWLQRRSWGVTAVAASLLVAVGVLVHLQLSRLRVDEPGAGLAVLERAQGDVVVLTEARRMAAREGMRLPRAAQIVSEGAASRAVVCYAGLARLEVGGATHIELSRDVPGPGRAGEALNVFVHAGRLAARIERPAGAQRPGCTAAFVSPHAVARVMGTELYVDVAPDATRVDVRSGQVEVLNRRTGESVRLTRAQYAVVSEARIAVNGPLGVGPESAAPAHAAGLIALYRFDEGRGSVVHDSSGVGVAADLALHGTAWRWIPGGGLAFRGADHRSIAANTRPRKLYDACAASGELSVEVWLRAVVAGQPGPARIIVFDAPDGERSNTCNWLLAHGENSMAHRRTGNLTFRLRTSGAGGAGITTTDEPLRDTRRLCHVVCTYSAAGGTSVYVNGELATTSREPEQGGHGGPLGWDPNFVFGLGNRSGTLDRPWEGDLFMAAVYARCLSAAAVAERHRRDLPRMQARLGHALTP
ncbi:MAG: LamG domain-containing protein [Kiritimatiellae bacterium]|nr:LamG domain-containing protein [Kiritimatiellia bacterium]